MCLTIYVDNILFAGTNLETINATYRWLSSIFKMKDISEAKYVLDMKIVRNPLKRLLGMF